MKYLTALLLASAVALAPVASFAKAAAPGASTAGKGKSAPTAAPHGAGAYLNDTSAYPAFPNADGSVDPQVPDLWHYTGN